MAQPFKKKNTYILKFSIAVSAFLVHVATISRRSLALKLSSWATAFGSWRNKQERETCTVIKVAMVYSSVGKYIFWHSSVKYCASIVGVSKKNLC